MVTASTTGFWLCFPVSMADVFGSTRISCSFGPPLPANSHDRLTPLIHPIVCILLDPERLVSCGILSPGIVPPLHLQSGPPFRVPPIPLLSTCSICNVSIILEGRGCLICFFFSEWPIFIHVLAGSMTREVFEEIRMNFGKERPTTWMGLRCRCDWFQ